MVCPDCLKELSKDKKHGEGVWECKKCGSVWFILKIRKSRKEQIEKSM